VFTGLIETAGRVGTMTRTVEGAKLAIRTVLARELAAGESISVNGVCLTVTSNNGERFEADVVAETLRTSTLGALASGDRVNLERALRLGDRLGGHIVTGHVDAVAVVLERRDRGRSVEMTFEIPAALATEVVPKGSVALDGTSLTVAAVEGRRVTVAFIPETLAATRAGEYRRGTRVNVETDVLAKHLRKLLSERGAASPVRGAARPESGEADGADECAARSGLTLERLRELGF